MSTSRSWALGSNLGCVMNVCVYLVVAGLTLAHTHSIEKNSGSGVETIRKIRVQSKKYAPYYPFVSPNNDFVFRGINLHSSFSSREACLHSIKCYVMKLIRKNRLWVLIVPKKG